MYKIIYKKLPDVNPADEEKTGKAEERKNGRAEGRHSGQLKITTGSHGMGASYRFPTSGSHEMGVSYRFPARGSGKTTGREVGEVAK